MVVPAEVLDRDVSAEFHPAVEPKAGVGGDLVKGRGDRLDLLMVGGDARAHEPEGRREPIEEVDGDDGSLLPEEMVRRVVSGRAGPHDGDPQGLLGGPSSSGHRGGA